jgi:GNAT superfamily N-acetyltransferase
MTGTQTINIGRLHFRVRPWQSDSSIAHLTLAPGAGTPTANEISECLVRVRELGYHSALTSAIDTTEVPQYRSVGFVERDRLVVLRHDLDGVSRESDPPDLAGSGSGSHGVQLRRARRRDRSVCLEIDHAAFEPFWRLDEAGLADAEAATPQRRFRVAQTDTRITGYAVTGRGGSQGFVQRLATDPRMQRRGIAALLVSDALSWCKRRHCREVFVNTQVSNTRATRLYEKLGFVTTPNDLVVLFWSGG